MKDKITKLVSILTTIIILCASCSPIISYAIDDLEGQGIVTNNKNVEFDIYFDNNLHTKILNADEDTNKIYLKVAVKNAGYIENTIIDFSDCNFTLLNNSTNNLKVQEIKENENKVVLTKISSGEESLIELDIKPINGDKIKSEVFNKDSIVKMTGTYTAENAKDIEINKNITIHTEWNETPIAKIETQLTKYIPFTTEEESGLLVQSKINVNIENDVLPIKTTKIEVIAPMVEGENPEKIYVYASKTASTNGKLTGVEFNERNYSYNKETGLVEINISNTEDLEGFVSWIKKQTDEYFINYIYSSNVLEKSKEKAEEITTKSKVTFETFNNVETKIEKEETKTQEFSTPVGNKVDLYANVEEDKIQKGYMYNNLIAQNENKIETKYTAKYTVAVNYSDLQDAIIITENKDTFLSNSKEDEANVYDSEVKVNKQELINLAGENAKIIIESNDETISTISAQDTANDDGNIVANVSGKRKNQLTFKIDNVIKEGIISIYVDKCINKDLQRTRADLESYSKIEVNSNVNAFLQTNEIENNNSFNTALLEEPTTKATISINNPNLSTGKTNEDVQITVLLDTDTLDDMLYLNPTIAIDLPTQITNAELKKVEILHSEELSMKSSNIIDGEEGKKIVLQLNGNQTKYNDSITKGVAILVYANLTVNDLAESTETNLKMTYTNNNDIYGDTKDLITHLDKLNLNLIAPIKANTSDSKDTTETTTETTTQNETNGLNNELTEVINETTGKGLECSIKAIAGEKELQSEDTVFEGQAIEYKIIIKNNTLADVTNLNVIAQNTNAIYFDLKAVQGWYQTSEPPYVEYKDYHYYDEMNDWTEKKFDIIDVLKVGETVELPYQVIIKEVTEESQTIDQTVKISANEIEDTTINGLSNKIKQAEMKVNLKGQYAIDDPDIYGGIALPIYITVQNLTDEIIEEPILTLNLDEGLSTNTEGIYPNTETDFLYELISNEGNKVNLKLNTLQAKEERVIPLFVWASSNKKITHTCMYASTKTNIDNEYISNKIFYNIEHITYEISATQTCSVAENTVLKHGDKITYNFMINNQYEVKKPIEFVDEIPSGIYIDKVIIEKESETIDVTDESIVKNGNTFVHVSTEANAKEVITIKVTGTINKSLVKDCIVNNYANISSKTFEAINTNVISRQVEKNIVTDGNEDGGNEEGGNEGGGSEEGGNEGDGNQGDTDNKGSISGKVWFDKNQNSAKDPSETPMDGINVMLLNSVTGELVKDKQGNTLNVTTSMDGTYEFQGISKGKYIVVFQYDSEQYVPTEYKKVGISDSDNSKVIEKDSMIDGKKAIIAVTDTITVTDSNIEYINMGLILREKFDLSLNKVITKITVQNSQGNEIYEIDDKKISKVEIPDKYIAESTIIIEYKISITNEGNVAGYARDIVDYLPSGTKFSSEMNKDWYQLEDGSIHTNSLEKQLINIGETKEITVTLIKNMTETSAITISNNAEIAESRSITLKEDIDSVGENKNTEEDDISSAKLLITIKTGSTQICVIGIIILLCILGITIMVIKDKEE